MAEALSLLFRTNWGQSNPAFRRMCTTMLMPESTLEQQNWLNEVQQLSATPDNAARVLQAIHGMRVAHLLPKVSVPTIVFHAKDDGTVPIEAGRRIAATIPGARFVVPETATTSCWARTPPRSASKRSSTLF